jgi:mannose-1-phosphate guanylyltransferase/phosphomannomutase
MLSRGDRLLGYIAEGYWKDVGNLDEYLNVHLDILSGKVGMEFEGKKAGAGNVWIGENSRVDFTSDLQNVVIGKDCVVGAGVSMENVVIGDGCTVEEGAVLQSSVLWPRTRIHKGARLLENIIGSDCEIRGRAFLAERAVISDHCRIGTEAVVKANVKVWPHKEVEDGAVLSSSLVWGGKWARSLFSAYGIYGLANHEITPEFAAKVGAAFAATFGKKVVISTSRDSHKTSRMINRAIMTGMLSVGVDVHDYGVTPLPVVRYLARSHREEKGGVHARKSPFNPSFVDLKFFDDSGMNLPMSLERSIEMLFFREDFVRADTEETGEISFPVGGFDTYVDGWIQHRARPLPRLLGSPLPPNPGAPGCRDGCAEHQPRRGEDHENGGGIREGAYPPGGHLPIPLRGFRGDDRHRRGKDFPRRREGRHSPGLGRPPGCLPHCLPA